MRPQMRIQAVALPARHKMSGNVAMRDLAQRMHAGVGAACAMNANVLAADRLDRGFQRALHRGAIVLDLPAAERRAVIFDCQLVAGHQLSRAGGRRRAPDKKTLAFIGSPPAFCNSRIRIASRPQATVSRSSNNSPGRPSPYASSQRKILTLTA